MEIDADGKRLVSGRLWFYGRYMLSDPMEVLMRDGQVIFNKVH